ncbi:hypothetical protein ACEQPO_14365 [Bacillus sp. SL00103]
MKSIGLGAMNLHGYLAQTKWPMKVKKQETCEYVLYDGRTTIQLNAQVNLQRKRRNIPSL